MGKMWKCPKCKREFAKIGQLHSCTIYPLSEHFKNKDFALTLYKDLLTKLAKKIGMFKVESIPCCIHFVSTSTFAAIFPMKDRIRIHFTLTREMKNRRIIKSAKIAINRFQYRTEILKKSEIDSELLVWLTEASTCS